MDSKVADTTVRVIGKCPTKGCTHRIRRSLPGEIIDGRHGRYTTYGLPIPGQRRPAAVWDNVTESTRPSRFDPRNEFDRLWIAAMYAVGFVCPEHDRYLRPVAVKGIVNVDKPCSARCKSATGPNCECVCGGDMHGAKFD